MRGLCLEPTEVLCLSLANRDKLCADLHKLEHFFRRKSNAGYVALRKGYANNKPWTGVSLTPAGLAALERYLDDMERLVASVRSARNGGKI